MAENRNILKKIQSLPNKPGVYLMRDRLGRAIYVGKAKDLKKRVSSYFHPAKRQGFAEIQPKIANMVKLVSDLEVIEVRSEAEALILESKLIKELKPKYNTLAKDDKRFLLVRVDVRSTMPQFRLTRNRIDRNSLYFGPFVSSAHLKKTLQELRNEFGILLGDATPRRLEDGRYKLYDDVRAELYGNHPNEVTPVEYVNRVKMACKFLEEKAQAWKLEVQQKMEKAALARQYEKASEYRDLLFALQKTLSPTRLFLSNLLGKGLSAEDALLQLGEILRMEDGPRHIECFDISHVSGTFVVASMVHFSDGVPDKAKYRRYKIKSFTGNDDYRAMEEVVARRYRRLSDEGKDFPDLVVIDGGLGQVNAALKAFLVLEVPCPMLIGLAKKKETIVFADGRSPLNLPMHSPALQLLQRIRDEAHRFANSFNAELRSKRIKESILDGFHGLGPLRKQTLLEHFGGLVKLRKASVEQIQEVPGIGPKTAEKLHEFLRENT